METSERPDNAPKRHILQFIGVTIALAVILVAGLYFLNRRTATPVVANDPVVSKPEEKPADKPKEQPKPESQTGYGDTKPSISHEQQPSQIASAGPADSLWLTLLILAGVVYLANEYRRSRTALWRAAMHKIAD